MGVTTNAGPARTLARIRERPRRARTGPVASRGRSGSGAETGSAGAVGIVGLVPAVPRRRRRGPGPGGPVAAAMRTDMAFRVHRCRPRLIRRVAGRAPMGTSAAFSGGGSRLTDGVAGRATIGRHRLRRWLSPLSQRRHPVANSLPSLRSPTVALASPATTACGRRPPSVLHYGIGSRPIRDVARPKAAAAPSPHPSRVASAPAAAQRSSRVPRDDGLRTPTAQRPAFRHRLSSDRERRLAEAGRPASAAPVYGGLRPGRGAAGRAPASPRGASSLGDREPSRRIAPRSPTATSPTVRRRRGRSRRIRVATAAARG